MELENCQCLLMSLPGKKKSQASERGGEEVETSTKVGNRAPWVSAAYDLFWESVLGTKQWVKCSSPVRRRTATRTGHPPVGDGMVEWRGKRCKSVRNPQSRDSASKSRLNIMLRPQAPTSLFPPHILLAAFIYPGLEQTVHEGAREKNERVSEGGRERQREREKRAGEERREQESLHCQWLH